MKLQNQSILTVLFPVSLRLTGCASFTLINEHAPGMRETSRSKALAALSWYM